MIQVVVLDFDGVLVESADVKTEAFAKLFPAHPTYHDAIRRYHLRHAGISRHVKIRHIVTAILGEPADERRFEDLAERFRVLVEEQVADAPVVRGAREFLRAAQGRYHLYIASGTPEPELRRLAGRHGFSSSFVEVYGSPTTKPTLLRRIAAAEAVPAQAMVMVGDGESDRDAADETGVPFAARVTGPGPLTACRWQVRDLSELQATIDRIDAA